MEKVLRYFDDLTVESVTWNGDAAVSYSNPQGDTSLPREVYYESTTGKGRNKRGKGNAPSEITKDAFDSLLAKRRAGQEESEKKAISEAVFQALTAERRERDEFLSLQDGSANTQTNRLIRTLADKLFPNTAQ